MLRALCHTAGSGWVEVEDLSTISDLRADPQSLVWGELDVTGLTPQDLTTVAEEFDLDSLAVEDSVNLRQRPKLEAYDSHLFTVLHQLDEHLGQLEPRQISCFVGRGYVLVAHAGAGRCVSEARTRLQQQSDEIDRPARMLHVLVDTVVDDYEAIAGRLEDRIEQLEDQALRAAGVTAGRRPVPLPEQTHLYSIKQQVSRLRRYALPLTSVLERIGTQGDERVSDEHARRLFQDVHDHTLRIQAQIRNIDDLATAVLDLTRGEQADTLNEINRKLTAWAAIVAVPTLVTSFYGMNVHLLPPAGSFIGLWLALALMGCGSVGLYVFFRRRGWL